MLDMIGEVLTGHERLDVRHVGGVLISQRRSDVRHETRSPNRSIKITCLAIVKSRQVKVDMMHGKVRVQPW